MPEGDPLQVAPEDCVSREQERPIEGGARIKLDDILPPHVSFLSGQDFSPSMSYLNIERTARLHNAEEFFGVVDFSGERIELSALVRYSNHRKVFFGFRISDAGEEIPVALRMPGDYSIADSHSQQRFLREKSFFELRDLNDPVHYWPKFLGEGKILHPTAGSETDCMMLELLAGMNMKNFGYKYPSIVRDPRFVLAVAIQLAHAMEIYGEDGYVLRDIKPENIMIGDFSTDEIFVKLFDGSVLWKTGPELTYPDLVVGTTEYGSPENASREKPYDIRDDLYSLGVVMFEMLEGMLPFVGDNDMHTKIMHITNPIPRITADVSEDIKNMIYWLLAKQREDRPANPRHARGTLIMLYNQLYPNDPLTAYFRPALEAPV